MIAYLCGLLVALWPLTEAYAGGVPDTTQLYDLVEESLRANPEIETERQQMAVMDAKIAQEGSLPPPELILMREGMPAFRYADAMFSRIELMQMIPFPSKVSTRREIAEIGADHAHHDHMEKEFDVLYRLKSAYAELWYMQQSIGLARRNGSLMRQALAVVRARVGAGNAGEEELLKASVESGRNDNLIVSLRQKELAAKSMIMALLGRAESDTIGVAVLEDSLVIGATLETLQERAAAYRPMLLHDSLMVMEQKALLSSAHQEYLPDFRLGVQYMTAPMTGFSGWTVTAGITLPFVPWTLGARSAHVDESEAGLRRAGAVLDAGRFMVRAAIRDGFSTAEAEKTQWETYRTAMLPAAEGAFRAALAAYGGGKGDVLMVLDAARMLRDLAMESLMLRMNFARAIAGLEKEIGVRDLSYLR